MGNRLTKDDSGALTTYTYDVGNQLSTEQEPAQVITYSYDNKGNITVTNTGGSLATQTWDYENRVVVIETASERHRMAYDADGLRRQWDEADTVKKFIWDNQDVLLETTADVLFSTMAADFAKFWEKFPPRCPLL
ncbi:MAG: RHS repeat protein [Armatimonadetes bacterium]|nr:RHS repeat protein [Armatimonadota bacterium]